MVHQLRLFRDLMNEGIIDIIADILQSQDRRLILIGTDILILFLNQDPNLMRSFATRQEGVPLLGLLVKGMLTDFGDDMHCQFLEILRSLLDSFASGSQKDTIIEIFYEKHLGQLVDVITSSCPQSGDAQCISKSTGSRYLENQTSVKPEILLNICDLLCFCILHHPYRIKCNFILNNVIDKVLFLTRRREKYLIVAAVRFIRTLISRNDDHLMSHIVKNNLLKPVIDAFIDNGNRYNLLNSAVLELFEYIRKENLKILLKYLVDSFWVKLVIFENLPSLHSLKVKYEQSLENMGGNAVTNVLDSRRRIDERALEKEEEDYFNEESDEEDSASASMSCGNTLHVQSVVSNGSAPTHPSLSSRTGGLVDYDDDEDDEDYKPPPRKQSEVSQEDVGMVESFRLKQKLSSREEPELIKRRRLSRQSKLLKDGVFTALCTTLNQAVLPSTKTASPVHIIPSSPNSTKSSDEVNNEAKGSMISSDAEKFENHADKDLPSSKICSDSLHSTTEIRQQSGDDCPLIPPKSSPEMTVNGS